jgi:cell division protease FtsH
MQNYFGQNGHIRTIPYSEFQQNENEGKMDELVIGRTQITGAYKNLALTYRCVTYSRSAYQAANRD